MYNGDTITEYKVTNNPEKAFYGKTGKALSAFKDIWELEQKEEFYEINIISIDFKFHKQTLGFWGFGVLGFWGLGFRV